MCNTPPSNTRCALLCVCVFAFVVMASLAGRTMRRKGHGKGVRQWVMRMEESGDLHRAARHRPALEDGRAKVPAGKRERSGREGRSGGSGGDALQKWEGSKGQGRSGGGDASPQPAGECGVADVRAHVRVGWGHRRRVAMSSVAREKRRHRRQLRRCRRRPWMPRARENLTGMPPAVT